MISGKSRITLARTCEHLSDLEGGNANGDELGGSLAGCAQRVVTVHDSVDEVVDCAEPSACEIRS